MTLQDNYDTAMAKSREATLSEQQKAGFYSLMMQSTTGDAFGERPANEEEGLRFDAWKELAGTSKETAMQKFIDLGNTLP